jgi:hypothetical protein
MAWAGVCIGLNDDFEASGVVCERSSSRITVRCRVVSGVVLVGNGILHVPRGTKLEPQVKTGSWAGCTHS